MIGVGTSLLFGRRAGKGGSPIPPFNDAMVDAWFMSGLSNIDKPSSITGVKGNEIQLKNFAYSLSSGFGKYEVDFTNLFTLHPSNKDCIIYTPEKIEIIENLNGIFINLNSKKEIPSYKVQVFGVTNPYSLKYQYFDKQENHHLFNLPNDGIYTIPKSYLADDNRLIGFIVNDYKNSKGITITQLPSAYEDALVFDGVDDYGICTGLPIMTDYTVICRREIINKDYYSVASNADDTDTLTLGIIRGVEDESRRFLKGAIYYFALYDKSLTIEEIETEKERLNEEWLKRSKVTIPEPDVYYDLSLKDNSSPTRNIIDDLSGNEHDAEIFNAAYTESSGYRSDGAFVFDSIDDYAIMQNVTKGFKTLFMEVIPSLTTDKSGFLYDQRVGPTSFGINISLNHIAYNAYNWGGVTYINGKLNTTMNGKEVYLKHQIITIVNGTDLKPQKVVLGGDIGLAGYFSNMVLYKLIGFYDELTPLQIEKVINDYKLKYD